MKIAILGAGFAGLSCAYHLGKIGHQVTVFEKEDKPGGLAAGFKEKGWQWSLEKHYHHFFTNDYELINVAKELGLSSSLIFPPSTTSIYTPGVDVGWHPRKKAHGQIYPFNTPWHILTFSPLSFLNRLRLGLATGFLKLLPESMGKKLEKYKAYDFSQKLYGQEVFELIWKPLLQSKFGNYADKINASWFWARIKKRTLRLGYVQGGFQTLADALAKKIKEQGGKIFYNMAVTKISYKDNKLRVSLMASVPIFLSLHGSRAKRDDGKASEASRLKTRKIANTSQQAISNEQVLFDAVISTLPTPTFLNLFPKPLSRISHPLSHIPHLHALTLVLITNQPFLKDTYWLNIADSNFPFLCLVQHTNFMDKKYYERKHILYISNYLPEGHSYFKKSAQELLKIYEPYLKKINPSFRLPSASWRTSFQLRLFTGPFAQPVFFPHYSKTRPFCQILPSLYFANLDSVYPWDRGVNYALEIGRKVAEMIGKS